MSVLRVSSKWAQSNQSNLRVTQRLLSWGHLFSKPGVLPQFLLVRRHNFRFGNFHDSSGYSRQKTLDENKENFTCISRIQRKTYVLVCNRNHYFGLGPKPKPKLDNTFGWYHNLYRNHIFAAKYSKFLDYFWRSVFNFKLLKTYIPLRSTKT